MDWSKGFSSSFYACFIDPNTWADDERFEITGGSIQKNEDGLLESATVNCVSYQSFSERWIRVWMDAVQDGDSVHEPLFTGLAINPERTFNGFLETNSLNCYSVLKPADDVLLPKGWFINKGENVRENILKLLEPTKAPILFDGDPAWLTDTLIAEQGETNLSMARFILDTINWRILLDGYGRIHITPSAIDKNGLVTDISSKYGARGNDVIELSVRIENDWFESPNVFRAISGGLTAIARDDNPESEYSTVSRGREIWMEESDVVLDSKETLANYARRRLKEEQFMTYKVSYTRRFDPMAHVSDIVEINYPQIDLNGLFQITSQTVTIGSGASTSEEVYLVN